MQIRPATVRDESAVRGLLADGALTSVDLDAEALAQFLVAADEAGTVLGTVGIQAERDIALMRSLAVRGSSRSAGIGRTLVAAAESRARCDGIHAVYLLTTTAEAFFTRLGYRVIERSTAPPYIRGTAQFAQLCPASSVLMEKVL